MRKLATPVFVVAGLLCNGFLCWTFYGYHTAQMNQPEPCPEAPQPEPPSKCLWLFHEYKPSAFEEDWVKNVQNYQGNACGQENMDMSVATQWVDGATAYNNGNTSLISAFSRYTFRNNCSGEISVDYIEPLAGLTRHPYYCLKGADWIVNKDYLVVSWNVTRKASGNSYYFDLGASLYDSGAGGASQAWFVEMYERRGIIWDGIFSWEMQNWPPSEVWAKIPKHLKPVYHWYNIPVNPEEDHPDNPLNYIKRTAKVEDFVLLKIDIDNGPIETALVSQLIASNELMSLVDEFYYEHHVNVGAMHPYWGAGWPGTLADTYAIFNSIRQRGILAHSWV